MQQKSNNEVFKIKINTEFLEAHNYIFNKNVS